MRSRVTTQTAVAGSCFVVLLLWSIWRTDAFSILTKPSRRWATTRMLTQKRPVSRSTRQQQHYPANWPLYSTKTWNLLSRQNLEKVGIRVLSKDPLVYTVDNLLSTDECQALQDYVMQLPQSRPMTRSNPPQVSLDTSKLWPLPFLSVLAGLPPVLRLFEISEDTFAIDIHQILVAAMPNVLIAFTASTVLAFGIVLPLVRKLSLTTSRTSDAIALNQPEDFDVIASTLVNRVSSLTGHPWDQWEAPVVTRYSPGAVFAKHGDASPTKGSEWEELGGQRVITCICYLKTLQSDSGGETYFDKLNLAVAPVAGTALIFFPADCESWIADDRTTHESLPPQEEKWIVQMFGRVRRVPHPLGLPDSYAS